MSADVKWIKIVTDIFDDEKILLIESMPESDGIIVIWFKLLCLAGKQNNNGILMLNDKLPYTDEMLAHIFRRPLNTVRLALNIFEQYGMVEIIDNTITIPNWGKHQQQDKLEKRREYQRNLMAQRRAEQKKKIEESQMLVLTPANTLADVRPGDKEEDIDIYNNDDNARAHVETLFGEVPVDPLINKVQKELSGLTDTHYALLDQYRDTLGDDLISFAIDQAVANGSRKWAYVEKVLINYEDSGIRTVGEAKAAEDKRRQERRKHGNGNGNGTNCRSPAADDYANAQRALREQYADRLGTI